MKQVNILKLMTLKVHSINKLKKSIESSSCFVEKAYFKEVEEDKIMYTIDINKCRKNILYYGKYSYCVFTVFDKVQ